MGFFVNESEVVYVTMEGVAQTEPGGTTPYFAIRAEMSVGEQNKLQALIVAIDTAASKADAVVPELQIEEYLTALEETFIVGWRLPGPDGNPVPFDRALIRKLSAREPLVDKTLAEIALRNPTPSQPRKGARPGSMR